LITSLGAGEAVIGSIVAEFTGAKYGIGKNLFVSAIRLDPDLMMSSLFLASLLGLSLYGLVVSVERKYGKWYLN
jgi:ABC-type nitrate/sulfonate/bicarbonate transport system permease component